MSHSLYLKRYKGDLLVLGVISFTGHRHFKHSLWCSVDRKLWQMMSLRNPCDVTTLLEDCCHRKNMADGPRVFLECSDEQVFTHRDSFIWLKWSLGIRKLSAEAISAFLSVSWHEIQGINWIKKGWRKQALDLVPEWLHHDRILRTKL